MGSRSTTGTAAAWRGGTWSLDSGDLCASCVPSHLCMTGRGSRAGRVRSFKPSSRPTKDLRACVPAALFLPMIRPPCDFLSNFRSRRDAMGEEVNDAMSPSFAGN